MNILVLEDSGSVSFPLSAALREEGHFVFEAYNANDAESYWADRGTKPIDCMIVDLNMPPDGLTEEEKAESQAGVLTGWLWLKYHVFAQIEGETKREDLRKRVIIYSDYLPMLRKHVPDGDLRGIKLFAKRGPTSSAAALLGRVRQIDALSK